jgi:hypothetical protein
MSVTPLRSPSTISDLVGWFTGFSAEMNALNELARWRDLSGKGNHVESSAMRSGSINLSASATNENVYDSPSTDDAKLGVTPFPYLYGSTDAGLQFPATMMTTTSDYTLFHVARYYKPGDAVPTRKRIFDGVTANWLSGFHGGKSGVAYHGDPPNNGGWLTSQTDDIHGDTWVLSTDQKDMYRSNGTDRTVLDYSEGSSRQLSINHGYHTEETSDWAVAEVIVYDRELTLTEYQAVEAYLNAKYFSTNLEIPSPSTGPISIMSFATYLHDGTGYPISLQSLASNFGLTSSISFSDFTGKAQIPRVSPVVVTTSDLPTQVFTIRGPSFISAPIIKVVDVDENEYVVSSTEYVSEGVATFTLENLTPEELDNQPFKVKIGSVTSIDTISSFISLPTRRKTESLTYDLNNDLGVGPHTISSTSPDGLSISGGILSGTLTTAGTYDFTITGSVADPDGEWAQQVRINGDNTGGGDEFGARVAISGDGNTAIVGAPYEDTGGDNAGSAYIFIRDSDGNWIQQKRIQGNNTGNSDFFGASIEISGDGNTAIVAARAEAYIFTRDSDGIWSEQAHIQRTNLGNGAVLGSYAAISRDGNTAILGARVKAYIFIRDSNGTSWSEQAQIQADNIEFIDHFGFSVAISEDGNTAIVGARVKERAYIFTRDSDGIWSEQAQIQGNVGYFGSSIAISRDGNTAIVGAPFESTGGDNAGSAYIFIRDSDGIWSQPAQIQGDNTGGGDQFGTRVAISGDGNTVIVGARYEDTGGTNAGSAYIFTRDSDGTWTEKTRIKGNNTGNYDYFGISVAISGDGITAIVGASFEDTRGGNAGSAYIFNLPLLSRDYRMVVTN